MLNTLENIAKTIQRFLPSFQSQQDFEALLFRYGWLVDLDKSGVKITEALGELITAFIKFNETLSEWLDEEEAPEIEPETDEEQKEKDWKDYLADLLKDGKNIYTAILNLHKLGESNKKEAIKLLGIFENAKAKEDFLNEFPERLIEDIFTLTLQRHYPIAYGFLHFFGIIEYLEKTPTEAYRVNYTQTNIDWGRLGDFVSGPSELFKEVYSWDKIKITEHNPEPKNFQWEKFLHTLERSFLVNRFLARYILPRRSVVEGFKMAPDWVFGHELHELQLPFIYGTSILDESFYNIGLGIMPIGSSNTAPPDGILITPVIEGGTTHSFFITPEISLQLAAGLNASNVIAAKIFPDRVDFPINPPEGGLSLNLVGSPYEPWMILGDANSHRLELHGFDLGLSVIKDQEGSEVKLSFGTISPEPDTKSIQATIILDEADAFVTDATQQDKIEAGFDLDIEWSNLTGFRFGGSASLDFKFNLNKKLGPITLINLYLGISLKDAPAGRSHGPIEFRIGFGILGDFGPVKFKLENMGMAANLIPYTMEEVRQLAEPPLLGKMDLDFGFAPPKGFGFVIDAKAVKGGGYLEFRDGEYLGYAELSILNKISVKAIGIVTTVLPDGQDGYSFLLLITAEFQPIQLGLGFSLSGVGGLVGLHRDLNVGAIIAGMDNDTYKHILFPDNIIDNFDAIINSLNAIMPIRKDQYAFGIMLQLEWGTGGFITIQLGVLFSLPDFAIAVIGIVKAVIKRGDSVLVNIVFQFSVTYDDALFTFDGSLEGSKLLWWKIDGDLAVRIKGGDNRFFLMSAGGFHKKYSPPGGLKLRDPMERLSITLYEGNPHVYAEVYFAITSNTLQFGGGGYATYSKWGFGFDAALGFDALIQFSPLEFEVSVYGKVEISVFGYDFFGVELRGDVTGPYPLKITLFAKIKIGGYTKVKRVVLAPKGEEQNTELEGVSILPILIEQLEEERNWMPSIPINTPLYVTLRNYDLEVPDEEAVKSDKKYHPIGSVTISQSRVPLNIPMDHFGYRPSEDYEHFQLVADSHEVIAAHEYFAPAQFFKIAKGEEFKRKAYEKLEGGIEISGKNHFEGGTIIEKKWGYEQSYIDPEFTLAVPEPTTHEVEENQHKHFSKHTTITNSSRGRALKQHNLNKSGFGLKDTSYAVKRNDQTTPYGIKYQNIKSESEAYLMMREINEQNLDKKDRFEVVPMHEVEALTTP